MEFVQGAGLLALLWDKADAEWPVLYMNRASVQWVIWTNWANTSECQLFSLCHLLCSILVLLLFLLSERIC